MNRVFNCVDCGAESETYSSLDDLEAHIAGEHLNIFPYECEKCKWAKFPTEFALISHNQTDHGLCDITVKYRYSPELAAKKKELIAKLQSCLSLNRSDDVSSTEDPAHLKIATTPIQEYVGLCSPQMYLDSNSFGPYQAFLDEALQMHQEESISTQVVVIQPQPTPNAPPKVRQEIACTLCGDVVSKQRSSMVYHANTRHGKFELYECGYCHRKWQTIAKSDVIKHIKSHHEQPDGTVDSTMVIDYRKNLGASLKEVTEQCFPERKKRRIGYTDVGQI